MKHIKKVKVIGAGSIGNHLAHAARSLGCSVDICDIDPDALTRTVNEIYPQRYGKWDENITTYLCSDAPTGGYDLIVIGTPPEYHNSIAIESMKESPKAILVEKPICGPDLADADKMLEIAQEKGIDLFVGYDHVVGDASDKVADLISKNSIGNIQILDVEFREFWGGIFSAHPWLDGPKDSYLGFWKKGGGACGEHSHAINLWQYFANLLGIGKVTKVNANLNYVKNNEIDYDDICLLNLVTENKTLGRVVQDVVTEPTRKWARIQGDKGFIEWECGVKPGVDQVRSMIDGKLSVYDFKKTRPDDFIKELSHIDSYIGRSNDSPISLIKGLETMLVIAAAHDSSQKGKELNINYALGFNKESIF